MIIRTKTSISIDWEAEIGFQLPGSEEKSNDSRTIALDDQNSSGEVNHNTSASIELDDDVLNFIRLVDSKYGDPDIRALNDLEKMANFMEDNFYMKDMFTVCWEGSKYDSFRAFLILPNGERHFLEQEWFLSQYIYHNATSMGRDHVFGGYKEHICMVVPQGYEETLLGTVWTFYLYPLEDCYLSYIGKLDTTYDPTDFKTFNFFIDLWNYREIPIV